jgi:hypothetical protein
MTPSITKLSIGTSSIITFSIETLSLIIIIKNSTHNLILTNDPITTSGITTFSMLKKKY